MRTVRLSSALKVTASLATTALLVPATVLVGVSATIAASVAITISLSAIALADYGRDSVSYRTAATVRSVERHALAA